MNLKKNLNNLSYKNKILYLTIIFLIIFFTIFYVVIKPSIKNTELLRVQIIDQKVELEKNLTKDARMVKLSDKVKKIEPQIDKINNIFIKKNQELEFITLLEGVASENKITQKINFDPSNAKKFSNYSKSQIKITAKGEYKNIINYLKKLESLQNYINIYSLNLTSSNLSSKQKTLDDKNYINKQINLAISAYIYLQ